MNKTETNTGFNLLVVLGATATGKTALAVKLARELDGEIISADSRQVYRGMDIGTGKDLDEYDGVPYHLIDILDPGTEFNLFEYMKLFYPAFNNICERGRIPVMCGGTGLYLESVLLGYELHEAKADPGLRRDLEQLSLEKLKLRLIELKPDQHNKTDLEDRQRTIRAIEIAMAEKSASCIRNIPTIDPFIIGVTCPRAVNRERITRRLKERLRNGMAEEVKLLLEKGVSHQMLDYYGLEYRFISQYLQGSLRYNDMFQKLNSAIHQFAKRQDTWFRRMEKKGVKIHWVDGEKDPFEQSMKLLSNL